MTKPRANGSIPLTTAVKGPRIFYGWWVLAAGCTLWMYAAAYMFIFGIFMDVFSKEYGWSVGVLSPAFSVGAVSRGVLGPPVGYLVDRLGPRGIMLVSVVLTGVSFMLVRFIDSIGMFYLIFGFLLAVSAVPINSGASAAVTQWFHRRRAFALSLLTTAWMGGGAIIAPSAAWLVNQYGWQSASTAFGLMFLATGIPLSLVMRHKPEPYGYLPDGDPPEQEPLSEMAPGEAKSQPSIQTGQTGPGADFTLRQAIKTRAFWMLTMAGVGYSMAFSSVFAHQIPMLTHRGFDSQTAANALGLMALLSALGRPAMGYLGDRYSKQLLLAGFITVMAVGILVLSFAQSMGTVYLYGLLYGVGFAVYPLAIAIVADYFGRRFFATIQQTIFGLATVGFVLGPIFVGLYFDATQGYGGAFIILAVVCFGAALLFLFSPRPVRESLVQ